MRAYVRHGLERPHDLLARIDPSNHRRLRLLVRDARRPPLLRLLHLEHHHLLHERDGRRSGIQLVRRPLHAGRARQRDWNGRRRSEHQAPPAFVDCGVGRQQRFELRAPNVRREQHPDEHGDCPLTRQHRIARFRHRDGDGLARQRGGERNVHGAQRLDQKRRWSARRPLRGWRSGHRPRLTAACGQQNVDQEGLLTVSLLVERTGSLPLFSLPFLSRSDIPLPHHSRLIVKVCRTGPNSNDRGSPRFAVRCSTLYKSVSTGQQASLAIGLL